MMLQSIDFAPVSIESQPEDTTKITTTVTQTISAAGIRPMPALGLGKKMVKPAAPGDSVTAPPAYDYPNREDKEFSGAAPNTQGIHRVYGGEIQPQFGYHGHVFASDEHAHEFEFHSIATIAGRKELDALVQKYVVPAAFGKPIGAEGIFCGQITCHNPQYAIALMARAIGVRVFAITPKFKTDRNNGRVKGHVEFYVERGNARLFTGNSKGLVCCEDGGFYVSTSQEGSRVMKEHSLHVPPTKVGIPQWPITLEPRRSAF